ncbi:hypothetical protein AB1Y20_021230 [Prymnesium parvum]|uniref:tRNA (guanine(26)-N(2))-dimethyltransferase n=1 Tax=Prymnesium parvum TaxID=97485 RepID=A0AB34JI50_PRYPA
MSHQLPLQPLQHPPHLLSSERGVCVHIAAAGLAGESAVSASPASLEEADAPSTGSTSVTEGKATIYFPSEKGVFYNPPQIPNRDLSVLVLHEFAQIWKQEQMAKAAKAKARGACREGSEPAEASAPDAEEAAPPLRVLDAMTASGLRAIRYSLEVPQVTQVVANDLQPTALEALRENLRRNGLSEERVVPSLGDAVSVMHDAKRERFEVIELDPYGTAAPFFDSAMQSIAEGGLMMVTCTDLAVLCGTYPEACYAKYGSYCLKGKHCHESALRIVLSCMEDHANRHRRYIVPLVAVHINFYVRLCVRVYTSPSEVNKAPTKKSYVYQCCGCDTFTLQPLARRVVKGNSEKVTAAQGPPVDKRCEHCGFVHHVGGPIWTAPICDRAFVGRLLQTLDKQATPRPSARVLACVPCPPAAPLLLRSRGVPRVAFVLPQGTAGGAELVSHFGSHKRLVGMLTSLQEELDDVPLFLQLAQMCSVLHTTCPPLASVISALMRQGYRVSRSHTDPGAIKTDAPPRALWDVLRCWCRTQTRIKPLSETSPAHRILSQEPLVEADFTHTQEAVALLTKHGSDGEKLGRFMPNPEQWGPGSRATSHATFVTSSNDSSAAGSGTAASTSAVQTQMPASMLEKRARNQNKRVRKRQAREEASSTTAEAANQSDSPEEAEPKS